MSSSLSVIVNGKEETTTAASVLELLQAKKVDPHMVSVEYNGEILDRGAFPSTILKPGDKIEFLYYMGGGAA
jgi:sulfur carrier protein